MARPALAAARRSGPRETELKYAVADPVVLRAWLDGGALAHLADAELGPETTIEVEDLYLDTRRGALARHGFGARLRRKGTAVTLTVKSSGRRSGDADGAGDAVGGAPDAEAALSRRIELEGPASLDLDPASWPASPARELIDELRGAARLQPLFTIRQVRHGRTLTTPRGSALITVDVAEVHAGRSHVGGFATLEVERTTGRAALLGRVAEAVAASGLAVPEPRSKEEIARGLVAARGAGAGSDRPVKVPKTAGVRADDPLAEAGRKVLALHLARMLAHEAGTRDGSDPEELHKMRVATRRMRAAWRVFAGAYRPRVVRRYLRGLRVAAAALGRVRDLDVILEGMDAVTAALPDAERALLAPLRDGLVADRAAARADLLTLLDGATYRDFVADHLDFTETAGAGGAKVPPGLPVLVRDTAGSRIVLAWEHVRAHDLTLAWADVTALHALRIDVKRLRYAIEAFREVLPDERVARTLAPLIRIQDHLGLLNDADVAAAHARRILLANAATMDPATTAAIGRFLAGREAEVVRLRRRLPPLWRALMAPRYRRELALLLAAL